MIRPETLWWGLLLLTLALGYNIYFLKIELLTQILCLVLLVSVLGWVFYAFIAYPHMVYERLKERNK